MELSAFSNNVARDSNDRASETKYLKRGAPHRLTHTAVPEGDEIYCRTGQIATTAIKIHKTYISKH